MLSYLRLAVCLLLMSGNVLASSGPAFAVGAVQGLILSKPAGAAHWGAVILPGIEAVAFQGAFYNPTLKQYLLIGQDKNYNALLATGSEDGATWHKVVGSGTSMVFPGQLAAVVSHENEYVAAGSMGTALENFKTKILVGKSYGTKWSDITGNASMPGMLTSITAGLDENGKSQYLLVGGTLPLDSPSQHLLMLRGTGDGQWQKVTLPKNAEGLFTSVTYDPFLKQYLASSVSIKDDCFKNPTLYLSKDGGQTWKISRQFSDGVIFSVNYIPSTKQYITSGIFPKSKNGHIRASLSSPFIPHKGEEVSSFISMSSDGMSWKDIQIGSGVGIGIIYAITYSNILGKYIAAGTVPLIGAALIISSTDGINWSTEFGPADGGFRDVLAGIASP